MYKVGQLNTWNVISVQQLAVAVAVVKEKKERKENL
jgi:hypothetical protein